MADPNGVIMTSIVLTVGSTLVAEQQTSTLSFKPIVGGWLFGMFLFGVASFDPDLAKMFAILVMVTALIINGTHLFTTVGKSLNVQTSPSANPNLHVNPDGTVSTIGSTLPLTYNVPLPSNPVNQNGSTLHSAGVE